MNTRLEFDELPREDRIRSIAYALWEEEGYPEGCDLEHWTRACELVGAETGNPDWLIRAEAETAAPIADTAEVKASLEDVVKRLKGQRAA